MAGEQSVRPFQQHKPRARGLSRGADKTEEEPNDMLVTIEGGMLPRDVVERDAETARVDAEQEETDDVEVDEEGVEKTTVNRATLSWVDFSHMVICVD